MDSAAHMTPERAEEIGAWLTEVLKRAGQNRQDVSIAATRGEIELPPGPDQLENFVPGVGLSISIEIGTPQAVEP